MPSPSRIFDVDCTDPSWRLSDVQKRTLHKLCYRRIELVKSLRTGLVPVLVFFVAVILQGILLTYILQAWGEQGAIAGKFVALATLPLAVIMYRRVACYMRRPYLRAGLPLLRMETCVSCGYPLATQPDKTRPCPECGIVPAAVICISCGHWLIGIPDKVKRCPECGADRQPEPREAAK